MCCFDLTVGRISDTVLFSQAKPSIEASASQLEGKIRLLANNPAILSTMKENFSPVLPAAIAAALNLKPEAEKAPKSCDGISDDKRSDSFWQLTDVTLKPEGKPIEAHSQVCTHFSLQEAILVVAAHP